jgi:hypothetical protein
LNVTNTTEPIFLAFRKDGVDPRELVYREGKTTPTAVRVWLRTQMEVLQGDDKKTKGIGIPILPATRFADVVGNVSASAVILFGSPSNEYYKALKTLNKVRGPGSGDRFANARFYRFDPEVQLRAGLPITERGKLWIAVYTGGKEVCWFPAIIAFEAMDENLNQCFKTELPPKGRHQDHKQMPRR